MTGRTILSIVVAAGALACTAPESVNPAPRCSADSDCAGSAHCHSGFCVPDDHGDAGAREDGSHDGCHGGCDEDERCRKGRCEEKDDR